MKTKERTLRILNLLLALFFLQTLGCNDSLWSPLPETHPPQDPGWVMDRAEDDFETGANWTDVSSGPDPWAVVLQPDRPKGDSLVFTNTNQEVETHIALWQDAELLNNTGAGFQVLAKTGAANWMGVVINYQPDGSYYLFRVQPTTCLWDLQRVGPSLPFPEPQSP